MALSTDFVLRTGPFDHTGKIPTSDEEGGDNLIASHLSSADIFDSQEARGGAIQIRYIQPARDAYYWF